MSSHTKSLELAIGILGIIVGLGGIYATLLTFPGALDAVGSAISGSGLPDSFRGLAGGVTLFLVILVGVIGMVALFLGLAFTLEKAIDVAGYSEARAKAFSTIGALFWVSTFITIILYSGAAATVFFFVSLFLGMVLSITFAWTTVFDEMNKKD